MVYVLDAMAVIFCCKSCYNVQSKSTLQSVCHII